MNSTVRYTGYQAKVTGPARSRLYRALRAVWRFVKVNIVLNTILYPYGRWRHKKLVNSAARSQSHTYTCFNRAPAQLEALVGPVMQRLRSGEQLDSQMHVLIFACSSGAEAYTVASVLSRRFPELSFKITASDLHQEMIDQAVAGRYSVDEVYHSDYMTDEFVGYTFEKFGDFYVVKPALRERVSFVQADMLALDLKDRFQLADIVFAQNVLFHLPQSLAERAFENVCSLLKPEAALFVEGMDLEMKSRLVRKYSLVPLEENCRTIYEQSRVHVPLAWWRYYYGSEPYFALHVDRLRRYSSIFFRCS